MDSDCAGVMAWRGIFGPLNSLPIGADGQTYSAYSHEDQSSAVLAGKHATDGLRISGACAIVTLIAVNPRR
jgi:hypothetical protein